MKNKEERIRDTFGDESEIETNVFVMIRYGSKASRDIEKAIRSSVADNGLKPYVAKDQSIMVSLWENIKTYMDNCKYGVAVFEDTEHREFNPNVSLELGYMMGQGKRCLLLKEQRMPRLPTDIVGHIYRSFDIFNIAGSIRREIAAWVRDDLGLAQPDEVEKIFLDKSRERQRLQSILMLLCNTTQPVTPHEIERHLHPRIGDYTTDASRLIEKLRWRGLIVFVDKQDTLGSYKLPQKVRSKIVRLQKAQKGTP